MAHLNPLHYLLWLVLTSKFTSISLTLPVDRTTFWDRVACNLILYF
jgi:hypothetical protein